MRKPLPILKPNPNNKNTYSPEDYPKPLGNHCIVCGYEPCKCHKRVHDKSEE